jgi:hypothetical protein
MEHTRTARKIPVIGTNRVNAIESPLAKLFVFQGERLLKGHRAKETTAGISGMSRNVAFGPKRIPAEWMC